MSEEDIDIKKCDNPDAEIQCGFNIAVVGEPCVGKTNLIQRFMNNTFNKDSNPTYKAEFIGQKYIINNEIFTIALWETPHLGRFQARNHREIRHAIGTMLLYDATNINSFDSIERWYSLIKEVGREDIIIILVGTKRDLKDRIVVTTEMSHNKAKSLGIEVFETSALDSTNVKEAFLTIIKKAYQLWQSEEKRYNEDGELLIQLNNDVPNKKNKCIK